VCDVAGTGKPPTTKLTRQNTPKDWQSGSIAVGEISAGGCLHDATDFEGEPTFRNPNGTCPQSARHGLACYELDPNWYGIAVMRNTRLGVGCEGAKARIWRSQIRKKAELPR
jgi:hypothetical protein